MLVLTWIYFQTHSKFFWQLEECLYSDKLGIGKSLEIIKATRILSTLGTRQTIREISGVLHTSQLFTSSHLKIKELYDERVASESSALIL